MSFHPNQMVPPMGSQMGFSMGYQPGFPQQIQGNPSYHSGNTQDGGRGRGKGGRGRGKGGGRGRGKGFPQQHQQHQKPKQAPFGNELDIQQRLTFLELLVTKEFGAMQKELQETQAKLAATQQMVEDLKMQGQGQVRSQATSQAPVQAPAQAQAPTQAQAPPQATVQAPPQASDKSWASQAVAPPSKGQASASGQTLPQYTELDLQGGRVGYSKKNGGQEIHYFYIQDGRTSGALIGVLPTELSSLVRLGVKTKCTDGNKTYTHFRRMSFSDKLVECNPEVLKWQQHINKIVANHGAKMQEAFLASLE